MEEICMNLEIISRSNNLTLSQKDETKELKLKRRNLLVPKKNRFFSNLQALLKVSYLFFYVIYQILNFFLENISHILV